jgi:hypothetical protein
MHRPPKNDRERLLNLIEALAEPGDEDDALDEEINAQLAKRGLTMETWAAQIRAQAQAVLDQNRRARRMRAVKLASASTVGIAAAAGVALALSSAQAPPHNSGAPNVKLPAEPMGPPDAGVDASRPESSPSRGPRR